MKINCSTEEPSDSFYPVYIFHLNFFQNQLILWTPSTPRSSKWILSLLIFSDQKSPSTKCNDM
jgi:hypothetical protein